MSEVDRVKEQLTYLRFWLGIIVVTGITLVGWLISARTAEDASLWFLGAFGFVLLGLAAYLMHRQVERRIEQIGKL
jgi:phosphoglycerol transferase MdoB-like AlkP superfamily enzyme